VAILIAVTNTETCLDAGRLSMLEDKWEF